MRGNLYQALDKFPENMELTKAQCDIRDNWAGGNNLFSISQIANRNAIKRGQAERQINTLIKRGIVVVWFDRNKNIALSKDKKDD